MIPRSLAATILLGATLSGCGEAPPPAMPMAEVSIVTAEPRTLSQPVEFSGAVEAYRSVDVRAQVSGVILERPFTEGAAVSAGQVLFKIDPTQYEATWRSARGRLAEAEARYANAERSLNRIKPLLADNAVARRDVDDAEAELERARASVEDVRGAVDRAKKDLDETTVRAEIAGRVGRAELQIGARVTGSADMLTTIDVLDPIYVSFRPTASQILSWKRNPASAKTMVPGGAARIELTLPDGGTVSQQGRIDFIDPVVDPTTGTQQMRATFTNKDRLLVPGQFVRVRVLGLERQNAIALPQRAVQQTLGRQFVYVVGAGDSVAVHDVETGPYSGGLWVIEKGVEPGDRVIVEGIQKVRPGQVVKPVPATATATAEEPKS